MRAAQRISASATSTSGEQPTTSQPSSTVTKTKIALSRNQNLPDKTQMTLVFMTKSPTPASSTVAAPDKPLCQPISLDKAHLLALWRCALPLARMEEVLSVLEVVFSEREAQVAKAALSRASRHRPSPRTTPLRRRTRTSSCTTPTSPWDARPTAHIPTTPNSASKVPVALSLQPVTPQRPIQETVTPHSSSQQCQTLHSSSQTSVAPSGSSQLPFSASQQVVTPCSALQQSVTPSSASQHSVRSVTPHSATQQSIKDKCYQPSSPWSDTVQSDTSYSESCSSVTVLYSTYQLNASHGDIHRPDAANGHSVESAKLGDALWSDAGAGGSQSHQIPAKSEGQQSSPSATEVSTCVM